MDGFIYETAIYDGSLKEWRVLNLNSGTFYGATYETKDKALNSIDDGEIRAGLTVKRLDLLNDVRPKL